MKLVISLKTTTTWTWHSFEKLGNFLSCCHVANRGSLSHAWHTFLKNSLFGIFPLLFEKLHPVVVVGLNCPVDNNNKKKAQRRVEKCFTLLMTLKLVVGNGSRSTGTLRNRHNLMKRCGFFLCYRFSGWPVMSATFRICCARRPQIIPTLTTFTKHAIKLKR